jgi:hypothetical protein
MTRLNQSRRQLIGYTYSPQLNNDVSLQTVSRQMASVQEQAFDQNMKGDGRLRDIIRGILNKRNLVKQHGPAVIESLVKGIQFLNTNEGKQLKNTLSEVAPKISTTLDKYTPSQENQNTMSNIYKGVKTVSGSGNELNELKKNLIRKMIKEKKMRKNIKGTGVGQNLYEFIKKGLIPNMKKDLGISKALPTDKIIRMLKEKKPKSLDDISKLVSDILLPFLVKAKVDEQKGGSAIVKDIKVSVDKAKEIIRIVQPKLVKTLQEGIKNALKFFFNKEQSGGSYLKGGSWWSSFWSGFKATLRVVGKVALKAGAYVAKASGNPVLGVALGFVDSQIGWTK